MIIDDFEKSIKELKELKEENNKQIIVNDERTRMSNVNQLDSKIMNNLFFSMISYMLLLVPSLILIKSPYISAITKIMPLSYFPVVITGGGLTLGIITQELFCNKIFKVKERIKSFSTAKNEKEKLEEFIHYQIELEKCKNRNKVINETIELLNSEQKMLNRISNNYELDEKNKSKEEIEQKIEELSNVIKEQYKGLDLFTTQKVLHDNFWNVRDNWQRRTKTMMTVMFSAMILTFFVDAPILALENVFSTSLTTVFAPFVLGILGSSAYMIKRNDNHKKVFKKINLKLDKNALVDNLKFNDALEEQHNINILLEQQIKDISILEKKLKDNKRVLELIETQNENNNDKDFERELENSYQLKEETKQNISRMVGLSYDEIINMDFDSLEKYIEQKTGKKPTYDLRMRIDGIPIDEEHILTLESLDERMNNSISKPKKRIKKL